MRASPLAIALLVVALTSSGLAQEEGELRVLSYNVHGLPSLITGDDTQARQRAISPLLEPFDVVGLQEDFQERGHALLVGQSSHPTVVRHAEALPRRIYGSGLTLLARPRALFRSREHFRSFHGVLGGANDGLASKGFLLVRLELAPGVELDVYDTHLDAGKGEQDQAARADQTRQLLEALRRHSAGRAVLLLGDTNLRASLPGDERTLELLLREAGLSCACAARREDCCGRIDRVLVRGGAGVELSVRDWSLAPGFQDEEGRDLSDHAPVQAVLRWRRAPL